MALFDYLYVDLPKVISLYSQVTGGVVELREKSQQQLQTEDNKRNYDFKIFQHAAGGSGEHSSTVKETLKPHHSVLSELVQELDVRGYLVDLCKLANGGTLSDPSVRKRIRKALCVRATGRTVIENYERLNFIAKNFPAVAEVINRSAQSNLRNSEPYLAMQESISKKKAELSEIKNRESRAHAAARLRDAQRQAEIMVEQAAKVGAIDPWVIESIQTWIRVFLEGIINVRIYPWPDRPLEHVFGHAKAEGFEDPQHALHFTWGSLPTEELTMVGIVASVPEADGESFDPMAEFGEQDVDARAFEKAFRGMFRGFDGMEQVVRTSNFPRVVVQPLMLYRSVEAQVGD